MQPFQSILLLDLQATPTKLPKALGSLQRGPLDTLVIEPDPLSIGIDHIKQAIIYATKQPLKHHRKSIIIHQAHTLTVEAQNALLKLLEEPPSYLDILLIAVSKHTLADTVLSRCHIIKTPHPDPGNHTIDTTALTTLLKQAPPARLNLLPKKMTAADAKTWCHSLIREAQSLYHHHPSVTTHTNLSVLNECLARLKANANPSITLTDAVLQLKSPL